jgi:hypothetical protein
VPHISLVFREMWDTADSDYKLLRVNAVVSHISRKTSEMWGTRNLLSGRKVGTSSN